MGKNITKQMKLFTIIQAKKLLVFKGRIKADFLPIASEKSKKISKALFTKQIPVKLPFLPFTKLPLP